MYLAGEASSHTGGALLMVHCTFDYASAATQTFHPLDMQLAGKDDTLMAAGVASGYPFAKDATTWDRLSKKVVCNVKQVTTEEVLITFLGSPKKSQFVANNYTLKPQVGATMLRNLLANRFELTFHHVQKELSIYALIVAENGPMLKESTALLDKPPALSNRILPDRVCCQPATRLRAIRRSDAAGCTRPPGGG